LIKKIIKTAILDILLQSNTSENSARMINMGKASDNADVLIKNLRILYNQTRQTSITNEIIEITNASILKK
jgi:F-type H+-transporting ATPase subunit gamma